MSFERKIVKLEETIFEGLRVYVSNNQELLDELHHGTLLAVTINNNTGERIIVGNGSAPYLKGIIKDIGNRHPEYNVFIITDGKTYEGLIKT
ncbi:hypothetical protein HY450_01760 [Candidatus Pacearchaeota archaeon]|nr:hypothetical protein [Candidatus Pacearchaeota archaeon]